MRERIEQLVAATGLTVREWGSAEIEPPWASVVFGGYDYDLPRRRRRQLVNIHIFAEWASANDPDSPVIELLDQVLPVLEPESGMIVLGVSEPRATAFVEGEPPRWWTATIRVREIA